MSAAYSCRLRRRRWRLRWQCAERVQSLLNRRDAAASSSIATTSCTIATTSTSITKDERELLLRPLRTSTIIARRARGARDAS